MSSSVPSQKRSARILTALLILLFGAGCAAAAWVVGAYHDRYVRLTNDAYYYLEMARSLGREGSLDVPWNQGEPVHFFPGYPILLGVVSLGSDPELAWPFLQVALTWGAGLLLIGLLWRMGAEAAVALGAGILFVTNAIHLKWIALPAAETAAIAWGLLSAHAWLSAVRRTGNACKAGRGTRGWLFWGVSGLAAGLSVLTRPDALWWMAALPVVHLVLERRLAPLRFLSLWAAAAAVPVLLYLIGRFLSPGEAVPYIGEFRKHQTEQYPANLFFELFMKLFRQPNQIHPWPSVNLSLIALHFLFTAVLLIALRGYLRRGAAAAGWLILGYLAAHSFWYYSSERFNLLALPAVAALTAIGLAWFVQRERALEESPIVQRAAYVLLVFFFGAVQVAYSPGIVTQHIDALARGAGNPRGMAAIAARKPGIVWADTGLEFAYYYYPGRTYLDFDLDHFIRRTEPDPAAFFRRNTVRWVLTQHSLEEWLRTHEGITTAAFTFTPRAHDGAATLYEVERRERGR